MTSRMRVRLAKLATLLGGAMLLWACNAPPIVIPPPPRNHRRANRQLG